VVYDVRDTLSILEMAGHVTSFDATLRGQFLHGRHETHAPTGGDGMTSALVRAGAAFTGILLLGGAWLLLARPLSEALDAMGTARVATLSPSPFGWNGDWLQFGPPIAGPSEPFVLREPGIDPQFRSLDLSAPGPLYGHAAEIGEDGSGRLVLTSAGKRFVLALRTGRSLPVQDGERAMPEYVAEPGDQASLTIERSLLAWPAPFALNVVGFGGGAATWKRHVYYRLSWLKASGARLAMLWAGEQPYDPVNLWGAPAASLAKVEIRQAP